MNESTERTHPPELSLPAWVLPIYDAYKAYYQTQTRMGVELGDFLLPEGLLAKVIDLETKEEEEGLTQEEEDELNSLGGPLDKRETEYAELFKSQILRLREELTKAGLAKRFPSWIRMGGSNFIKDVENPESFRLKQELDDYWPSNSGLYFLPQDGKLVYAPEEHIRTREWFWQRKRTTTKPDLSQVTEAPLKEWFYIEAARKLPPNKLGGQLLKALPGNMRRDIINFTM